MLHRAFAALAVWMWCAAAADAQPLTAADFTRPSAMRDASMSPDGRHIAAIQAVDGGEALVIIDWRARQAQAIQVARYDRSLFLEGVAWKNDNRVIFWLRQRATMNYEDLGSRQRQDSREFDVYRIFAVNRDGSNLTQLFENNRLAADTLSIGLIDDLSEDPEHVLVGTWGSQGFTLYRADVGNGRVQALEDADWQTYNMLVNRSGQPIMRVDSLPYNSGYRIFRRAPGERRWTLAHEVRRGQHAQNREFDPIAAGPGPSQVYVAARAEGEEYQAVYLYDTATGALGEPVFRHDRADAAIIGINPSDHTMLYGCGETQRWECRATGSSMQRHFDGLTRYFDNRADFNLDDMSSDGQLWLISAWGPTIPKTYYIYDVANANVTPVGSEQPHLQRSRLRDTTFVAYAARDGASLWGYLTAPSGPGPHPTVIMPHGGPQSRDSYDYDFVVQFLASRGYAVFQPNFRGSEGSGRSFAAAGFRQWGRLMQDDVTDGVRHLIEAGVADADRVCIVGISYGGYAALAGVALTPELYQCAVSIAGISDLPEMLDELRSDAGRRSAVYAYDIERVGDPDRDRDALQAASPRRHVDRITAPVLLIHGERDEVVVPSQSERMRDALQRAGKSVRYVEIEGGYHPWNGWTTTDARVLLEETERFLSQHIGSP